MIGRTAERKRQVQPREPGQEDVELAGIIRREHAGEPIVGGIVDGQARLHASEPSAVPAEHLDSAAELIEFRTVLGVIHDRISAARQWQRHIECFRLGARAKRRSGDDFERRSERETRQRAPGFLVAAFDDEFHVEFFWPVIQRTNGGDKILDDRRRTARRMCRANAPAP
jgi:hypothetical protein